MIGAGLSDRVAVGSTDRSVKLTTGATAGRHATEDYSGRIVRLSCDQDYWYRIGVAAAVADVPSAKVVAATTPERYEAIPEKSVQLVAGESTVIGRKYRTISRVTTDLTTAGAANNTAGTVFVATAAVALGAGDRLWEVPDISFIQATAAGTVYIDILK